MESIRVQTVWLFKWKTILAKEMSFKHFSWKYINFFFLLGLSPYRSIKKQKSPTTITSQLFRFVLYIPSVLYVIYVILIIFCFFELKLHQQISFSYSLRSIYTLNIFLNCFIALDCSPIVSNSLEKLWCKFESLEQYCNQQMQLRWPYAQCDRKLFIKYCSILLLFSFQIGTKIWFRRSRSVLTVLFTYSIIVITFLSLMHALFYLETFHFVLKMINKNLSISDDFGETGIEFKLPKIYERKALHDIEICKSVHYKLWRISKLINENFGWIFVCYFMQAISNVLNLVTWFIIDIHEKDLIKEFRVLSK